MLLIEDRPGPEIRATSPPPASLDQMRQQRAAKCSQVQERKALHDREWKKNVEKGKNEKKITAHKPEDS